MNFRIPDTPLQQLYDVIFDEKNIRVFVKRLDMLHPYVSGNKWFKLKYNLDELKNQNQNTVLTFGGAYSNHIIATAAIGKEFGIKTIGIIRGEEHLPLNPVLEFVSKQGMTLHYINREIYRHKNTPEFLEFLKNQFGDFYLIPEGGANAKGVEGCQEIVNEITIPFDYIAIACGTGTTIAGIALSLQKHQQAIGILVLKGAGFMQQNVEDLINSFQKESGKPEVSNESFKLFYDYHFGGYAKKNDVLNSFIQQFTATHSIPIEPVYTGKSFFGIMDLIKKGYFEPNKTLILLHCGGLGV